MLQLEEYLFREDAKSLVFKGKRVLPKIKKEKWKLLIVDDEKEIHQVTSLALRSLVFEGRGIRFISAYSVAEAKELIRLHPEVAVILLDVVLEEDDVGLQFVRYVREELHNTKVRIILRTGHAGNAPEDRVTIEYDINDYREKTELTAQQLRTSVITALRSYRDLSTIASLHQEIDSMQQELIYALGEIAEFRSVETGNHVRRVGEMAQMLALKIGWTEKQAAVIKLAASMHDVGKLAIHDSILTKPGALTQSEFAVIQGHCQLGNEMLKCSPRPLLKMAAIIAKEHHESYDGTGYPCQLRADDIHISSRIVALVDVFDALGNRRVYKEPWQSSQIIDYIRNQQGKKFDPQLVDLLLDNVDEFFAVRINFPDGNQASV